MNQPRTPNQNRQINTRQTPAKTPANTRQLQPNRPAVAMARTRVGAQGGGRNGSNISDRIEASTIPDISIEARTFGNIIISMRTCRSLLSASNTKAWKGKVRQFWAQNNFSAFQMPDFKNTHADTMFALLCPKVFVTNLANQSKKLLQYFKDQYDLNQKSLKTIVAKYGQAWKDSDAGQHLEALIDGSKDGEFNFELPTTAQDVYHWKGYTGIEFSVYHLVEVMSKPLKCLDTEVTSDGGMGWLTSACDPDGYWIEHQWNRVCRLIIGWVVTYGLYGANARGEAMFEFADGDIVVPVKFIEDLPPLKEVPDASIFFDDRSASKKPSIDLKNIQTDCHYYTLGAMIAGPCEKDPNVDYGKGTLEQPMTAVGTVIEINDDEEGEENDDSHVTEGGIHPLAQYPGIHTEHNDVLDYAGDELSAINTDALFEESIYAAIEDEREILMGGSETPDEESINERLTVTYDKLVRISNEPLTIQRLNIGHAFACANVSGQMYIMRTRLNLRLDQITATIGNLERERESIDNWGKQLDEDEKALAKAVTIINKLYSDNREADRVNTARQESLNTAKMNANRSASSTPRMGNVGSRIGTGVGPRIGNPGSIRPGTPGVLRPGNLGNAGPRSSSGNGVSRYSNGIGLPQPGSVSIGAASLSRVPQKRTLHEPQPQQGNKAGKSRASSSPNVASRSAPTPQLPAVANSFAGMFGGSGGALAASGTSGGAPASGPVGTPRGSPTPSTEASVQENNGSNGDDAHENGQGLDNSGGEDFEGDAEEAPYGNEVVEIEA